MDPAMLMLPSTQGEKCRPSCRYEPHATFGTVVQGRGHEPWKGHRVSHQAEDRQADGWSELRGDAPWKMLKV